MKESIKTKKPTTIDEAKEYACSYTANSMTKEQTEEHIRTSKNALESLSSDDDITFHKNRIDDLNAWLRSDEFVNGNYHQGIDGLLLDLIEWRAMFYAFEHIKSSQEVFYKYEFFQQWKEGGAYAMYNYLAKLVSSRGGQDKSLRKLWWDIEHFIEQDVGDKETAYISSQFSKTSKRFANQGSKSIYFRNKVIAHNEKTINASLSDLDEDLRILSRIWSFVIIWSGFPILFPWKSNDQVFSGFENFFDFNTLVSLKKKRKEYIDKVELWCKTNLVTSEIDKRSPFATISIDFRIT
jgi:hypothetical protein